MLILFLFKGSLRHSRLNLEWLVHFKHISSPPSLYYMFFDVHFQSQTLLFTTQIWVSTLLWDFWITWSAGVLCLHLWSCFCCRVIDRKPKDVWAVRFAVGAYLIDRKYFEPLELWREQHFNCQDTDRLDLWDMRVWMSMGTCKNSCQFSNSSILDWNNLLQKQIR